ncbi:GNAT family N-acetyltransferase, partial [Campylobacter coli]|nr:GNAT family N-acetyltransferase [Campylobacter coli]EAJ4967342.1 GNAT family N-acetyltransferase [Campylobacter coli]
MFKKAFYKGFKLSNYYDNFGTIEEKILKQEFILQKYKNNNFFFFNRVDNLLYYFINDLQNFNLKANYIKILTKTDKQLLQHNDFLKLNHFKEILNHKQMILKKDEIKLKKFTFISKASHEDSK